MQISRVLPCVLAGTLACVAPVVSGAQESDPVLMEIRTKDRKIYVTPAGDPTRTFVIQPDPALYREGRLRLSEEMTITPDTLFLTGEAISLERLGHLEVDHSDDQVVVRIYDRGPGARRVRTSNNRLGIADDLEVEPGAFVRGYVLHFGGAVRVDGEVNRSVVNVGGDVFVRDSGVVRGSVVSFGGEVHKTDAATVYGEMYADNHRRFRPRWYEGPEENVIDFNIAFDYNRVTGALPWARFDVGPRHGAAPALLVDIGYAFESELWHYRVGIGRDSWRGPIYYAGVYHDTRDDDRIRIGRGENTIFALLFGADYLDYYFAEGFTLQAGWALGEDREVRLGYHNERLSALQANTAQWTLFGGTFPPNYQGLTGSADSGFSGDFDGRMVYITGELAYRTPQSAADDEGTWQTGVLVEASVPELKSDFDYTRYYGFLLRQQPLWSDQSIRLRILAGGAGGRLPATRQYYLGGIGSLRGYDFKEFYGDRHWLGNLEYAWSFKSWEVFALFDAGQIGSDADWVDGPVWYDVGLGVQVQKTFRVQMAWAGAHPDRKPLVTVRFSRPF